MEIQPRPALPDDDPFLADVYASTREDELSLTGWPEEQKRAFCRMQFEAQRSDYRKRFPGMADQVILADGEPAGRMIVYEDNREIRLLDIALLPAFRNRGIGSKLIRGLQDRARAAGKPLRHAVLQANRAVAFYRRHGFFIQEEKPLYYFMEWRPEP